MGRNVRQPRWVVVGLVLTALTHAGETQEQPATISAVVVEEILPNSVAGRAGVRLRDSLLSYDGRPVPSPAALQAAEDNTLGKDAVVLRVRRGGDEQTVTVPLGKLGIQVRPDLQAGVLTQYEEGRASQRARNADAAIASWTNAAHAAQTAGGIAAAAWLHGLVGDVHEGQRRWKEASAAHARAWELLKAGSDRAGQSQTLVALGRCSQSANDFPAALDWYGQAAKIDAAAGSEMWAASDFNNLGVVAFTRGDIEAAGDYHSRALGIRARLAPQSLDLAASLHSSGNVAYERGDMTLAVDFFTRALAIRERQAPNSLDVTNTLSNIGSVAFWRGDLVSAGTYYRRALDIRERLAPDSLAVASSILNLGNIFYARGDMVAAHEYHSRSLAIRERLAPDSLILAASLDNIGNVARARGDLAGAREHHNRALAINTRLAPDSQTVAISLDNLGLVAHARGDLSDAQDYYNRSLAIKERLGPDSLLLSETLENLAKVARARGDRAAALGYNNRAFDIRDRRGPNTLEMVEILNQLGGIALEQRRVENALPLFTRAVSIVEAQRGDIRSSEARALLLAQHTESYTGLLRAHLALDDVPAAFATAERGRARSLLEILSISRAEIRQGVDPLLLERERRLQQQLNEKADRHARLMSERSTEAQAVDAKKALDALMIQYQEVQAEIRATSPRYAALTQPQPLGLREIQQQVLDSDSLLLEYVLGQEVSYLFAVTSTSIRSFELPARAEIERAARRVYELLLARQPVTGETLRQRRDRIDTADREYPDAAAALSQMVLGPVAENLTNQRLLVVADGALQYVPFGALPAPLRGQRAATRTTEETSIANGQPLIVNHEIVSLPSASVVAVLRRESEQRPPADRLVAVLADPVFDAEDPRVKRARRGMRPAASGSSQKVQSAPTNVGLPADVEQVVRSAGLVNDRGSLSRLPFTRGEADAIAALAPAAQATKAIDFTASRATVTSAEMSRHRIVHLATHGLLDTEHPELSGIVLSLVDEEGKAQDGFLRMHEVYNLNWSADLVVLSACQTALGKEINGEGLVGLTRGFMYGGAKRVLASLWNVNDRATAQFMQRFYQGLLSKGLSPAAALREAQLQMLKRGPSRAPYYWAAFVLQGEWR